MSAQWERVWHRLQSIVHYGKTSTSTLQGGRVATVQVTIDAIRVVDGVNVAQHFGFASAIPTGSDVVKINVTGLANNGIVIASGHGESRPTFLQDGESILYNQAGDHVHMRADRTIEVKGTNVHLIASEGVTMDTPLLTVNGAVQATGNVTAGQGSGDQVDLQHHTHAANGDAPTAGT